MPDQRRPLSPRQILALIMGGLVLWGVYIAIGAYLYNQNPWRSVIILACVGSFVGLWLLLLWTQPGKRQD